VLIQWTIPIFNRLDAATESQNLRTKFLWTRTSDTIKVQGRTFFSNPITRKANQIFGQ
jgi:hypothetical protein